MRWHVPGRIFATNKRKKHGGEGLGKSGKFRELTDRLSYHHSCELFWSLKRHEWPKKDSRAVLGVLLPDKSRHERDKARDSNRESRIANHRIMYLQYQNSQIQLLHSVMQLMQAQTVFRSGTLLTFVIV